MNIDSNTMNLKTPLIAWVLIAIVFCLVNFPPLSHQLAGPDDYMRGVRTLELLAAQDYGFVQPRLGGEDGTIIMWSRLADWPLYGLTRIFTIFTSDTEQALYWSATVLPLAQLLVFILLLCWSVLPVTGAQKAALAVFFLFFLLKILHEFKTGRIDHHGWQILFMLAGYGALTRMWLKPNRYWWPVIAGLCFATGLAIGADIILWLALGAIWTGMSWVFYGKPYAQPNLIFGVSLLVASGGYLLLAAPEKNLFATACDGFSFTYVIIAAAIPLFWSAIMLIPKHVCSTLKARLIGGAMIGGSFLAALIALFPSCFTDPYGLKSPILKDLWLTEVIEAQSLWSFATHSPTSAIFFTLPIVAGLITAVYAARKDAEHATMWRSFLFVYMAGIIVSTLQIRVMTFSQILALWPLAWAIAYGLNQQAAVTHNKGKILILIWIAFVSVLVAIKSFHGDQKRELSSALTHLCPNDLLAENLNTIPETLTLLPADLFSGSELLFRTHHRVLTAPYHRNGNDMLSSYKIFIGEEPESIARNLSIGIIIVCRGLRPFPPEELGENPKQTLYHQLTTEVPPNWLERRTDLEAGDYRIYQVKPAPL